MKILSLLTAFALGLGSSAFGKVGAGIHPATGKVHAGHRGPTIQQFDTDGNHKLEGAEVTALKAAFANSPAGSKFRQRLDSNKNGLLDDSEIAAVNARLARHADKASAKKKGKAA